MDYREFCKNIQKCGSGTLAKVRNSWGVYDCYKAIRKNQWFDIGRPLKEKEFYSIIRGVNNLLAKEVAEGREIVFPWRMGRLELRKLKAGVSFVNGKLKNTYPINWENTLRLWFEDKEAMENKILVRDDNEYLYHIKYNKNEATYNNKSFYEFEVNRFIKKSLMKNVEKGKIETLW